MKITKFMKTIPIIISLLLLTGCNASYDVLINENADNQYDFSTNEPYDVVRIVDGDTIIININNEDVRVRLIGIDTPESVHSDNSKNTPEGKQSSDFMTELLSGQQVYIESDIVTTDDYDRLLAYVYHGDTKVMINELLLSNGMANVMTVHPNNKYESTFVQLELEAMRSEIGHWSSEIWR